MFSALGSNLTLKDKKLSIDLAYPLPEIEWMVEIAPEIISTFEPRKTVATAMGISSFSEQIPYLRRGLNAIRTYFQQSGKKFWRPRFSYFPSIRSDLPKQKQLPRLPGIDPTPPEMSA